MVFVLSWVCLYNNSAEIVTRSFSLLAETDELNYYFLYTLTYFIYPYFLFAVRASDDVILLSYLS